VTTAGRPLVALYAATSFVTAGLLFVLEPLVAKGLLPVLGGGAAVWTTAVAFFQLALLAGYLYAHLGPAWLGARRHAGLHVMLLAAVAVALPLRAPAGWVAPGAHQALWLFGRLAVTIGPAFVLLAATAPLLGRWFASTRHREAPDPYFLYAASNAGSLLALLAYPILLEPLAGLALQRRLWMEGLGAAVALLGAAAFAVGRPAAGGGAATAPLPPVPAVAVAVTVTARTRLRWLALAAVPSSLLLSVTTYMTTDVVALPLLWVFPLALYLLTFVLAFGRRRRVPRAIVGRVQTVLFLPIAAEMFMRTDAAAWTLVPLHALMFFVTALWCHQALADSRPAGSRVTEFYLVVAAGGALGGLVNVFVAPLLFRTLLEYPVGLVAAALLRALPAEPAPSASPSAATGPSPRADARARLKDVAYPLALAAGLLVAIPAAHVLEARGGARAALPTLIVLLASAGVVGYSFRARPLRFALGFAAMMAAGATYARGSTRVLYTARSFYAAHRVVLEPPTTITLANGNTIHGAQDLAPGHRHDPLTYYHRRSPIGDVMAAWQGLPQRRRVGVVGLGAGSLAAYAAPGEHWTFFEIDPAVIDIARDRGLFTYLADAPGLVEVVPGDARLSLAGTPDGTFGIIALDAFTSDAVPAHLLTREAIALYLRKLAPGGLLALHLSNRYLDLEPLVAGAAAELGLTALTRFANPTAEEAKRWKFASHWIVLARAPADLAPLARDPRWSPPREAAPAWTDDKSNLWRALHLLGR
jgi:SAM-dependent methyltransferase